MQQLGRMRSDTWIGMAVSNLVAFFIILTAAIVLHAHGIRDIRTSTQAAEALRPVAGRFAFLLFSLGVIGTGLLAVPVLAGSSAYAVGESHRWSVGLEKAPLAAWRFYSVIAVSTLVGILLNVIHLDPGQGPVLERGGQRRGRGADHGHDHVAGEPAEGHGLVHAAPAD